jgi:hypothetical protein
MIAMCLGRAAYLAVGTNDGTKDLLRRGDQDDPNWGTLINQLQGQLDKARGPLDTLHQLRNKETEVTHPGKPPTAETMTTALTCFRTGARVLLDALKAN